MVLLNGAACMVLLHGGANALLLRMCLWFPAPADNSGPGTARGVRETKLIDPPANQRT